MTMAREDWGEAESRAYERFQLEFDRTLRTATERSSAEQQDSTPEAVRARQARRRRALARPDAG